MRLLLDSHVAYWMMTDRGKLSRRVLSLLEDDANELFLSRASVWELSIKITKGKLIVPGGSVRSVLLEMARVGVGILSIEDRHIVRMESFPPLHGDPFDRMIAAQSIEEGMTLLSIDRVMKGYAVAVVWD